ncbi:RagB/SusD family nutrient uptake outer membrane protein [Sphingobacterium hungaricum]
MKKYILIFTITIFCSCEKFLDVQPDNSVYESELFLDRSGFETALANVYVGLTSTSLYGRELKYGIEETLVGYYEPLITSHYYYQASNYNYSHPDAQNIINPIWSKSYNLINQCNIILKNIENIADDPYYNIIKGEALGLRALLHFKILKLFGPVISQEGLSAQAIPYFLESTYESVKFSNAQTVINYLLADLEAAEVNLQNDPIITNSRTTNLNTNPFEPYNSLIDTRGERMNIYAVKGLKAMVYQWEGDNSNAGAVAQELITEISNGNSFRLANESDFSVSLFLDRRMSNENLFGLYMNNLGNTVTLILPSATTSVSGTSTIYLHPNYNLYLYPTLYNNSVHGSTNDYRILYWFYFSTKDRLIKYETSGLIGNTPDASYLFEFKIVGLHDIYMIAAESLADSNITLSLQYLNDVRKARGLSALSSTSLTSSLLKEYIFAEIRKENIGDGQLFETYKRQFRNIDRSPNVTASIGIFKFPIPPLELQYNPN